MDKKARFPAGSPPHDLFHQIDILAERLAPLSWDKFDCARIADRLAGAIDLVEPPFVYALCGEWGSGKSTLIRYLLYHYKRSDSAQPVVYFNAWRASIHVNFPARFVAELRRSLQDSIRIPRQLKEQVGEAFDILLDSAVTAFSTWSPVNRFFANVYTTSTESKRTLDNSLSAESRLREKFEKISRILCDQNVQPVIIIDELDRCPPSLVVTLLEALRMFFVGPDELEQVHVSPSKEFREWQAPFKYVISMDEKYIARAFSATYNLPLTEAHRYVAKFIQARHHFPKRRWKNFILATLERSQLGAQWFPPEVPGDLEDLMRDFNVTSPREARQILGYLVLWALQYSDRTEGWYNLSGVVDFSAEFEVAQRAFALRLFLNHIALYAGFKVFFPWEVGDLVETQILSDLLELEADAAARNKAVTTEALTDVLNHRGYGDSRKYDSGELEIVRILTAFANRMAPILGKSESSRTSLVKPLLEALRRFFGL